MTLLQEVCDFIYEEFNYLKDLDIKLGKDSTIIKLQDFGEENGLEDIFYDVSLEIPDSEEYVILKIAKAIDISNIKEINDSIISLNNTGRKYHYYLNKYDYIVQRYVFVPKDANEIFLNYLDSVCFAREAFEKFKAKKIDKNIYIKRKERFERIS